jgi:hypothetical protein
VDTEIASERTRLRAPVLFDVHHVDVHLTGVVHLAAAASTMWIFSVTFARTRPCLDGAAVVGAQEYPTFVGMSRMPTRTSVGVPQATLVILAMLSAPCVWVLKPVCLLARFETPDGFIGVTTGLLVVVRAVVDLDTERLRARVGPSGIARVHVESRAQRDPAVRYSYSPSGSA